jgi:hypothetical protein
LDYRRYQRARAALVKSHPHLHTAPRTKTCRLIGRVRCTRSVLQNISKNFLLFARRRFKSEDSSFII